MTHTTLHIERRNGNYDVTRRTKLASGYTDTQAIAHITRYTIEEAATYFGTDVLKWYDPEDDTETIKQLVSAMAYSRGGFVYEIIPADGYLSENLPEVRWHSSIQEAKNACFTCGY